jgi:diguanylate cyclase (GGDEF)-like protein
VESGNDELRLVDAESLEREKARLLYEYAGPGVVATTTASTFLALVLSGSPAWMGILLWWVGMQAIMAVRGWDLWRWRQDVGLPEYAGARWVRRFSIGALTHSIGWGAFPLLFFHRIGQMDRTVMVMILSAMASGAITVLAPSARLAMVFCMLLLLSPSAMFLMEGGGTNAVIGFLGVVFCIILIRLARTSHKATLSAIKLSKTNEGLVAEMKEAYAELTSAQRELQDVNSNLEARIRTRTLDLEKEIGERARYAQELTRVASTDSLTGLKNRASFSECLGSELEAARANRRAVAVLFIDLDKFKEVNDVRGHAAGDRVLIEVAQRLEATLPKDAEIGRWGGDEFVVMLPDVKDAAGVLAVARRLRESVTLPVDLVPEAVKVDATIGIAIYPEHGTVQDELIRAADVAMYAAKQSGRQCVKIFEHSLADELIKRHTLAQSLRAAPGQGEFILEFQPVVAIETGECLSMEALLRWNHPELGLISPLEFIPLAERSGDIIAIGRWVLEEACRTAAAWEGPNAPAVAVNVSAIQVLGGTLADDVEAALARSGLHPTRLHIELTESLFAGDHERASQVLGRLRARGLRISIDDFGTGFSSLSYLQHLPIDTIKIDRSFVKSVETDSRAIVKAIISIAGSLGFELIAEGVETEWQSAALRALGVTQFQGFLVSKPISEGQVGEWLALRRSSITQSDLRALDAAQRASLASADPFALEPSPVRVPKPAAEPQQAA